MKNKTIVLTGAQIEGARWLTLRSALEIEIKTGMKRSRGRSTLKILQSEGITKARTLKAAWADLEDAMRAAGYPWHKQPWTDKPELPGGPSLGD